MNKEKSIIDGLMLGDGSIENYKGISGRLGVWRKIEHQEYNEWIMQNTANLIRWTNPTTRELKERRIKNSLVGATTQHQIRSSRDKGFLLEQRERWYLDKKTIPFDLKLNPVSLAVWFMDDGWLSGSLSNDKKHFVPLIGLCSQGFSKQGVDFLKEQLYDLGIKASHNKNGMLYISGSKQAPKFIEIVEPIIEEIGCMKYKIDMSRFY